MRTEDRPTAADVLARARPPAQTQATPAPSSSPDAPDLPGCRPIPLRRRDLDAWDDRFEYWDGATETAWEVRDPTGIAHEQPADRLVALCAYIAAARGAPIECYGTTDLERRDERGRREKILQADKLVYVYPQRARLPEGRGIVVGEHDLPDVLPGGGSHDGRSALEARDVRVVGFPGGVGGGPEAKDGAPDTALAGPRSFGGVPCWGGGVCRIVR